MATQNSFDTRIPLKVGSDTVHIFSLPSTAEALRGH